MVNARSQGRFVRSIFLGKRPPRSSLEICAEKQQSWWNILHCTLPKTNSNSTCQKAETPKRKWKSSNPSDSGAYWLTAVSFRVPGTSWWWIFRDLLGRHTLSPIWRSGVWNQKNVEGKKSRESFREVRKLAGKLRKFQFVALKQMEHQSEKQNLERHGISFN